MFDRDRRCLIVSFCMHVCMYARTYACMCVCICLCMYISFFMIVYVETSNDITPSTFLWGRHVASGQRKAAPWFILTCHIHIHVYMCTSLEGIPQRQYEQRQEMQVHVTLVTFLPDHSRLRRAEPLQATWLTWMPRVPSCSFHSWGLQQEIEMNADCSRFPTARKRLPIGKDSVVSMLGTKPSHRPRIHLCHPPSWLWWIRPRARIKWCD